MSFLTRLVERTLSARPSVRPAPSTPLRTTDAIEPAGDASRADVAGARDLRDRQDTRGAADAHEAHGVHETHETHERQGLRPRAQQPRADTSAAATPLAHEPDTAGTSIAPAIAPVAPRLRAASMTPGLETGPMAAGLATGSTERDDIEPSQRSSASGLSGRAQASRASGAPAADRGTQADASAEADRESRPRVVARLAGAAPPDDSSSREDVQSEAGVRDDARNRADAMRDGSDDTAPSASRRSVEGELSTTKTRAPFATRSVSARRALREQDALRGRSSHIDTGREVQVVIGHVEVRAISSPKPAPRAASKAQSTLSLDDYLRNRNGVRR